MYNLIAINFLKMYQYHILNYYYYFKVYLISLRVKLVNSLKNQTNIEKFERILYICDQITFITK